MTEQLSKIEVVKQVAGYEPFQYAERLDFQSYAEALAGALIEHLEDNQRAGLNPRYIRAKIENMPSSYVDNMLTYVMHECYLSEWGVGKCGQGNYIYDDAENTSCTMYMEVEMVGGTDEPLAV